MMRRLRPWLLLLPAALALSGPAPAGTGQGLIWGRVADGSGRPVVEARVAVSFAELGLSFDVRTDRSGSFRLSGVPAGAFALRAEAPGFAPYEGGAFLCEPASSLYVEVTLARASGDRSASRATVQASVRNFSQTVLSRAATEHLPSGNNIWNLVENQDLSATTSRIDVGGLWTGVPALFSSRGSCSWTQNSYLLNGVDLTDPYRTGTPLFYPDFFSWDFTRLVNADLPVEALLPGGYFDLVSPSPTRRWHGGLAAYYSDRNLGSHNVTPALEAEGLFESNSLDRLADFHAFLSGPLGARVSFYASLTSQSVSRDIADFEAGDESTVWSATAALRFDLSAASRLSLLWTGQVVRNPTLGAARGVDPAATLDARNTYNVLQAIWDRRLSDGHSLRAGAWLAAGALDSRFQEDALGPNRSDIFLGRDQDAAPWASRDDRLVLGAFADGQAFLGGSAGLKHLLRYGLRLQFARAKSDREVLDNIHLRYFEGAPLEVVRYNTPLEEREASLRLNLYGEETLYLGSRLRVTAGLGLDLSRGWVPGAPAAAPGWESWTPTEGGSVTWFNLSPRLAVTLPLSAGRNSFLRLSGARYYFALPLSYLAYGNPGAWGGLAYSWTDANGDGRFEEAETGALRRREGPLFGQVDPDLGRPSVDELMIALNLDFGRRWVFSLAGFLRETRNLVSALNAGVPFSDYDAVSFSEVGDDGIPGTHDDLQFTLYNQRSETLGEDFYLLTNPDAESRLSRYRGADVTLVKGPGGPVDFFFSFQAIEAIGTANPGNTALENDDGVIGRLYSDPNTLINARGRLRFDRGFTVRVGLSFETIAGIRLGVLVKYYDGQPFARKIIITGFNQGPFYIMAHPRGVARYEYNRTVDLRLEKDFDLGAGRLRLLLDGFNILNRSLATEENEWTGPDFGLRFATEIQSPRFFRLGAVFEF
jgi:hypothetical protein